MKKILLVLLGVSILFTACAKPSGEPLPKGTFSRIVSLSPSITKQIIDLGQEERLVGVTSFHPPMKNKNIPTVGNITHVNVEAIVKLQPDIVLFSTEDSTQQRELLIASGIVTHKFGRNSDFEAIGRNYLNLGILLGEEKRAKKKLGHYRKTLETLRSSLKGEAIATLFLVSHRPLITVSDNSYISHIIKDGGGKNIFGSLSRPYPVISAEALVRKDPQAIFVMTKGGKEELIKTLAPFKVTAVKRGAIFSIDPTHVAHYTPGDYVRAVEEIHSFFATKL